MLRRFSPPSHHLMHKLTQTFKVQCSSFWLGRTPPPSAGVTFNGPSIPVQLLHSFTIHPHFLHSALGFFPPLLPLFTSRLSPSSPLLSYPFTLLPSVFSCCFSAGTVSYDYSSWIAEPQPLCPSCLLYPQCMCVCV